ncbi:MAG: TRAP transporter small permease [Cereibacter changlensis]|uniref:TRAP transporter small permease protein n=2 Tax=Cereibacter changlensis TaxID=402884 RepID=A0A2T4JZ82_9RHOB|nr:TRAP transporter small permease [Cereibacter changlensis]PTE23214.1 TRAP transporter small permease [Cereibacter changlensis JA139]PZX49068.1 TRAP-type C4-dicarboxylate transport system permease small subunit [Cereibacter changlensis]
MQAVLSALVRGVDGVNWLIGWLMAALMAVMTVLISWQVFARYVMGDSLTFSEEVARFSTVWLTMLGAAYAYRYGALIAVELLAGLLGRRMAIVLKIVVALASAAFALILLRHGLAITERVLPQTAPSTRVSMAWLYAAMPAGAAMILLNALAVIADSLRPQPEAQP